MQGVLLTVTGQDKTAWEGGGLALLLREEGGGRYLECVVNGCVEKPLSERKALLKAFCSLKKEVGRRLSSLSVCVSV